MYEYLTILSASDIFNSISSSINVVYELFAGYFSGSNSLRFISIALITLAVILFVFLIIVFYVKSIVVFLKNDQISKKKSSEYFFSSPENDSDYAQELDKKREKELEEELEQSKRQSLFQKQEMLEKQRKEDEAKEKELEKEAAKSSKEKKLDLDLDWHKGKSINFDEADCALDSLSLEYQQSRKNLNELLGLIVDMLSRGVDELKIAQTILYRNQRLSSENDVIQTIDAVKDFIALCVNNKFKNLNSAHLPNEEQALRSLIKGDISLALVLLEKLMHNEVNKSIKMSLGAKRDEILKTSSYHAVTYGSFASLTDIYLAANSFELAIELNPQNVNAWGRLGDMYSAAQSHNKAVWAYENLLKIAEEDIYPKQVANAYKMLSKYHYEQGDSLQAVKYYNDSKIYYDSLGINRRLDRKELEIIEIIEAGKDKDIEAVVANILQSKRLNQYSYSA